MASINIEVELDEFSDAELIEEMKYRDLLDHDFETIKPNAKLRLHELYEAFRRGHNYDKELRELFYEGLGKIV